MAKVYNYDVMFDDTSIDVSKEVALVWSIANSLRGAYTSDKYKDVIIPMVIIRRFECALAATKQAVVDKYKANPGFRLHFWSRFPATRFTTPASSPLRGF